ncbi:ADP-ribosylation factor-binding protein GGA1 isoform X2 [Polyodon spathula]|uniref:ADP-ribosylation factor-binding protein GGA1 isoform X2 n=1 Tax=Polyodon spathula TaxID=7913 RepID=UPI001B7E1530|nr:ADP-ribosylation factor-binding protein GGA1 isoform X2 [Polyodon spathula]
MAAPPEEESLQSHINRATNPLNRELQWESIQTFCEKLTKDLEGPQLATRLLAHKIQSPQEWEALQALTYLGTRAPEKVKSKILEVMYSWTVGLPDETKIADAYQMLKKQGIVKVDPVLPDDKPLPLPPPRPKNTIFEDEEKSKMLARLLNSTHPEDLRAANKLIKEMVQEDQKRMEKMSKRVNTIEEVRSSVSLLTELLSSYTTETTSPSTEETIQELYQRCEKLRPTLFRLASDTEDNDEALAEILQANDSLTQVINAYKQVVRGEEVNGESGGAARIAGSSSALLDLMGLDTSLTTPSYPAFPSLSAGHWAPPPEAGHSLLDDELMSLGLNDPNPSSDAAAQSLESSGWNSFQSSDTVEPAIPAHCAAVLKPTAPSQAPPPAGPVPSQAPPPGSTGLDDLDLLGKTLLQQSLPPESMAVKWDKHLNQHKPTLRDLQHRTQTAGALPSTPSPSPGSSQQTGALLNSQPSGGAPSGGQGPQPAGEISLANVTVPLESIKPSSIPPVTVFDRHSFRVLFHFALDPPPARPDVLVVVISMISTAPVPVQNIVFQSAVPKVMKVKLQPPSGTELPAFNPVVPPAAITQVLLLANPHKEKVRMRFKLTFTMEEETYNEVGVIEQFPAAESWGSL